MKRQGEKLSFLRIGAGPLTSVALLSGVMNILTLSGSFFMLEVYDRVLPSRSIPTLVSVVLILAVLYAFLALFDILRSRIFSRLGLMLDEDLGPQVFDLVLRQSLRNSPDIDPTQPQRDLDQVRGFLAGAGPGALFDLPWIPIYLVICFALHPVIGMTALGGSVVLVSLTLVAELLTRRATRATVGAAMQRNLLSEAARRNAEVAHAMGMVGRLRNRWSHANDALRGQQRRTSDVSGGLSGISKVLRMFLQSAVLGVGAYLVIQGEATGGIMIAGSILVARAIAPVELAIANWKGFIAARQSWARLRVELEAVSQGDRSMPLPPPVLRLDVERLSCAAPGNDRMLVNGVSFGLVAGQALGVIGPSGAGKSSLARAMVGVWPAAIGKVRLDGAALDQWNAEDRGRHVGYLPQDIELFSGTIAENIARFDPEAQSEDIIAAARAADVHDLILQMPGGYNTQIGVGGAILSAGQRQRVGLARALYRNPFLVVLDEPNSNLDLPGEQALIQAIADIRARNGIAVIISHKPSILTGADVLAVMGDGALRKFGTPAEILEAIRPAAAAAASAPLKVVQA